MRDSYLDKTDGLSSSMFLVYRALSILCYGFFDLISVSRHEQKRFTTFGHSREASCPFTWAIHIRYICTTVLSLSLSLSLSPPPQIDLLS